MKDNPCETPRIISFNSAQGNQPIGQRLTAVKKEDYILASMIFVGYLVAGLIVLLIMGFVGGVAGILGFLVGILFTAGVYRTWKGIPRRSTG